MCGLLFCYVVVRWCCSSVVACWCSCVACCVELVVCMLLVLSGIRNVLFVGLFKKVLFVVVNNCCVLCLTCVV